MGDASMVNCAFELQSIAPVAPSSLTSFGLYVVPTQTLPSGATAGVARSLSLTPTFVLQITWPVAASSAKTSARSLPTYTTYLPSVALYATTGEPKSALKRLAIQATPNCGATDVDTAESGEYE